MVTKKESHNSEDVSSNDVRFAPQPVKVRLFILLAVWLVVFAGINIFYKTKLVLRTDYDWTIIFDFFGADAMLGLAMATTLVLTHEMAAVLGRKFFWRLSQFSSPTIYTVVQYIFTVVVGVAAVFAVLHLWHQGLYGIEPSPSFIIDMSVIAVGMPLMIIGLLDSFYYHGAWRTAQLAHEESARHALAAELEALRTHINPHFLFNSFATLSQFIKDDAETAVELVDNLSDVYRYVLQNRDEETVLLSDELQAVEALVKVQKARVPGGLVINIAIDAKARSCKIPTLTLYTLIENALKHNIVSSEQPLIVKIHVGADGHLIVENNVQLRRTRASLGSGLDNLDRRFKLMSQKGLEIIKSETAFIVRTPLLGYHV